MSRRAARIRYRPLPDEQTKLRGLPLGYRLKEHNRARIDAEAARMRERKPRGWNWRRDMAKSAERKRRYPYVVLCDCNGVEIIFGESETSGGGMPLNMARLVPWAKNPRVVLKL